MEWAVLWSRFFAAAAYWFARWFCGKTSVQTQYERMVLMSLSALDQAAEIDECGLPLHHLAPLVGGHERDGGFADSSGAHHGHEPLGLQQTQQLTDCPLAAHNLAVRRRQVGRTNGRLERVVRRTRIHAHEAVPAAETVWIYISHRPCDRAARVAAPKRGSARYPRRR